MAAKQSTSNSDELLSAAAALASRIDRKELSSGGKLRVHMLAKKLGLPSKVLLSEISHLGNFKTASSSIDPDVAVQVVDHVESQYGAKGDEPEQGTAKKSAGKKASKKTTKKSSAKSGGKSGTSKSQKKAEKETTPEQAGSAEAPEENHAVAEVASESAGRTRRAVKKRAVNRSTARTKKSQSQAPETVDPEQSISEDDAKLQDRVRKNVANEIHQIEEKVEAELVETQSTNGAANGSEDGQEAQFDDYGDVIPQITPKPTEETAVAEYAPIFIAPEFSATTPKQYKAAAEVEEGGSDGEDETTSKRRRRGRRGASRGRGAVEASEESDAQGDESSSPEIIEEPRGIKGSTRIEAQRRRRAEMREKGRNRRPIVSQAEFLARRESVERTMIVRERPRGEHAGAVTEVAVLEDDLLVEHFVTSAAQSSIIGNIYLGRVQNVLPSMEAAFIDIGTGRNGVLYASEINWRMAGLGGRSRKIEHALKSGDQVLVQVSKDPLGHKGARLTTQISLAGRFLVYVPNGRNAGISRKLPAPERKRLKDILDKVVPDKGGAIIRTAAEDVPESAIAADVGRLHDLWEDISSKAGKEKSTKGAKPVTLYEEPELLIKVVRDLFNEDFSQLIVDGKKSFATVKAYVDSVAPDLSDRVIKYDRREHDGNDAFASYRVDEQLQKALSRKVWLPSGGTLVIDRTEAMTVVDVNTGKFTGAGGNLEETITRNNLEAAEEIVRQMRLRDLGGMIVVDFIDMVLPENQELVLRRLKEALGRDRTRHQVSEVTSLGLVQMTRKRLGAGLLETFSTECEHCHGRGLILHDEPVEEEYEGDYGRRKYGKNDDRSHSERRTKNSDSKARDEDGDSVENASESLPEDEKKDSRKGRRARRGRRHGKSSPSQDSTSIEDLASSVVKGDWGSANSQDPEELKTVDDIAAIAYGAAENAEAQDDVDEFNSYIPDEAGADGGRPVSGAHDVADSQEVTSSFEQARAEFEKSPRRKRRTRGNSRSDFAPRPEDFPAETEDKSTPAPSAEDAHAEPTPESDPKSVRARRRNRRARRARRVRTGAPAPEAAKEGASKSHNGGDSSAAVNSDLDEQSVGSSRRRRRRVVRRGVSVAKDNAADPSLSQGKKDAVKANSSESASHSRGRGRRRVARRRSQ